MKDSSDNKTGDLLKSSGAKRQEAYRKRQQAAGKRQRMVWIHDESWQAGFKAGEAGTPSSPVPDGIDGLSWFSGWIEGEAKRLGGK